MSEWIVYSKDGITEKCTIKSLEYSGSWMGECYITSTIKSATPLSFSIGDYLEYRGERFEINYDPSVIKSATSGTYGEGFTYDNVKFNSLSDELTRCDFLDYVPEDNLIHYSSLPNFSFFADTIDKLAERIQVNLDRVYTGEKKWTIEVYPEYVNKTNVNIVVSNMTCWDALALVKSQFNANFVIKNRTITIGTEGIAVDNIFSYGKGNGLVTIERNAETDQKIVTRLRAYGSTRNLPMRYYFNNGEGIVPNNMAVQNLMLPSFPKETLDPYVDSENISELGIREATIFFDGSGEFEEIYPSMEGMTAEDLISAGIQVSATGRLDEVVGAEQITDNGIFEPTEEEPKINIPTFTITLKDVGFDINDHLSAAGSATISMKDGMCGGREFEIVECKKEGNNYILTCNRAEDTSLGLYFPYNDYNIKAGDKFVLLNIEMPDVYIQAAAQRLLSAAKEYLAKNDYVRYSYTPKVDNIYMARQHDTATSNGQKSIHDTIKEGDLMLFEDNDLLIEGSVIIDTLSIKEGEGIPEYEITLRNDKTVGTIEKIQNQIDSIVSGSTAVGGSGGYNASQIKSLIKTFGSTFFLRKGQPDTAREVITFEKGLNVGEFVTGASGASFFKDLTTGQTIMELDKLYVRMKAFFETLTIVEAQTISGKQIISPAGSVRCTNVEEYDDYYRCYFLNEQDGEKIENKFIVGDQVYSQMFNAKTGTSNKISNRYYWRLVTGVGENYIDLSKTDCDADSDAPMVGDILNQRGHRYPENSERMNFIETSTVDGFSPSITLFHGVNSFSLAGKDYVQFGVDKTTNKAFMNVYGDMYVGDRNKTAYMRYTQEEGLVICGKLDVGTKLGDSYLKDLISASTPEGYQEFVEKVTQDLEGLQAQIDGTIDSYFFQYEPSLDNYPAREWDTESEKQSHLNDTFTNLVDGRSWRWSLDGTYKWVEITDTATTKALALAGKAQDTADGKRRVFVDTPYPPYDKGDLWSRGSNYPLMICVVPKESGVYAEGDFDYADNNVKLKEEMQTLVTETKSELNNSIGQAKEAANKYTDEGITSAKEDINAIIDELEKAKANVTEVYSKAEADGKITEAETSAINAAKAQADAAIALSETTIKAYADGIVDDEEAARIKQAQENLAEAKEYAEEQAQAAKSEIENSYLFQALQDAQSTEIANGLVLTSLIQLRDTQSNIMSGINGLINASKGDKSIATWWGGDMLDLIDYYRWDGTQWVVKSGLTAPSNIPSGLIRMDGTGYLAKGKFWWDNDGKIYADPTALFLSFDVENEGASLSATILDIRDKQTEFANMWSIETDSNGTKYLYSKYPLVSQGGVTMYAGTSGLDVEGIYDGLPIDGSTIYWENGVLKAVGGGGVADSVAWSDITGKPSFATVATSGSYNDLLNKPTLLSSFTNDVGFITSSDIPSTYDWSAITSKPTTLRGYGITDGNTWMLRLDTRSVNPSPYGSTYTDRVSWHLKYNETIGITTEGTYSGVLLLSPWSTSGGGSEHQLAFGTNGRIYHRHGAASWSAWDKIITNTSLSSTLSGYLPLSGGTITGGSGVYSPLIVKNSSSEVWIQFQDSVGSAYIGTNRGVPSIYLGSGSNMPILHSGNYSSYALPLTGGTLTGQLNINGNSDTPLYLTSNTNNTWVGFKNSNGIVLGYLGVSYNNQPYFYYNNSSHTIYHSGNLTKLSQLTNDSGFITSSALSGYLPLTGGTLSGNLTIGTTATTGNYEIGVYRKADRAAIGVGSDCAYLFLYDSDGSMGAVYVNSTKLQYRKGYTWYDIWHSGNDGSGSGLDADTLDGYQPSSLNVGSATKLQTARTIWGQSFDGTGNVSGNLSGVGDITGSGSITIRSTGSAIYLKYNDDPTKSVILNSSSFKPYDAATNLLDLGTSSARWKGIYGNTLNLEYNSAQLISLKRTSSDGGAFIDYFANNQASKYWRVGGDSVYGFTFITNQGSGEITPMLISASGRVGIGTNSPSYKLHVNGSLNATTIYQNGTSLNSLLGNYLPLSGGTITNTNGTPLIISSSSGYSSIKLSNKNNHRTFGIKSDGELFVTDLSAWNKEYVIFHSGNLTAADILFRIKQVDGSGSGLDADTLDGYQLTKMMWAHPTSNEYDDCLGNRIIVVTGIVPPLNTTENRWGAVLQWSNTTDVKPSVTTTGNNWYFQLWADTISANLHYRKRVNGGAWSTIKALAFTTDNVASATKLATARTIWGQSFDGTGNVTGYLTFENGYGIDSKDTNGKSLTVLQLNSGNAFLLGQYSAKEGYDTVIYGNNIQFAYGNYGSANYTAMFINPLGNIGINTVAPSAKLHVVGNILTTGGITMYSARILKNIVDERGLSLKELSVIKPTRYTWKDKRDERLHIGGIADDIQQVLPEVVYRTPDGVLTMDYGNAAFAIASSLIKPMIEHESEIVSLKRRVRELEEEVKRLRA